MPRIVKIAALVLVAGCQARQTTRVHEPPPSATLHVLSRISYADVFPISSAVGRGGCGLLLADGHAGRIVEVSGDGRQLTVLGAVPGVWRFPTLEPLDSTHVAIWSDVRPYLGVLDLRDGRITSARVAQYQWGGAALGPLVMLAPDRYATIPAGDPHNPRREPPGASPAPLVEVRTFDGTRVGTVDTVAERGGRYLSWRGARSVMGRYGDTILVLELSDATVHRYVRRAGEEQLVAAGVLSLPRYFVPVRPRETVTVLPWILINGDLMSIDDTPALGLSAIGADGTLYVIRNADFQRPSGAGAWRVDHQALEVYSARGVFKGAFAMPARNVVWLEADGHGRLLFGTDSGVVVTEDPTSGPTTCPVMPPLTTSAITTPRTGPS